MNTIVFVREEANPRLYNQALALKRSNKYKLILLCRTFDFETLTILKNIFNKIICYQPFNLNNYGLYQNFNSSLASHFMKYLVYCYFEPWVGNFAEINRLPSILENIRADVFNCPGGPYKLTQRIIKQTKCPVILDLHNGSISKGIDKLSKIQLEIDSFNFENAAGIIHRGKNFEIEYYKKYEYNINCPILNYLDACNKEFFVKNELKKISSEDSEYHLVDIGSGLSLTRIALAKKLAKQKIHYHLYSVPYSLIYPVVFKELNRLNKFEKYFHLERTVPFHLISQEISKYDFGSMLRTSVYLNQYTLDYLKVATSYRIFNYLEAGLPVIISERYEFMKKIIEENKIGFSIKDSELGDFSKMINKNEYSNLRSNVIRTREKLRFEKNENKVVDFYTKIIEGN